MKQKYYLVTLIAVCTVATLLILNGWSSGATAQETAEEETLPRTITVIGEGRIKAKPDTVQINIGVEESAATVKEAADKTDEVMTKLMSVLEKQGITDKDMQTSNYSVYAERPYVEPGMPQGEAIYRFSNNITVMVRDLTKVESILSASIEAGSNNIYGATFGISDQTKLKAEGRKEAVAAAKAKAQELAELNGVTVGEVVSISEVIAPNAGLYNSPVMTANGMGDGGGPISPGELEIIVQLQITYAIQ
jgi:hypothetical protein